MGAFLLKIARFMGMLDPIADPPQISTKFQVIIAASIALWFGKLTPTAWEGVAIGYMGANVVQKVGLGAETIQKVGQRIGLLKAQKDKCAEERKVGHVEEG